MSKLYSSKHILKTLIKKGFYFVSQRGSHIKYRKNGNPILTIIIPHPKKEIPMGTFHSILRQSRLSENDFRKE